MGWSKVSDSDSPVLKLAFLLLCPAIGALRRSYKTMVVKAPNTSWRIKRPVKVSSASAWQIV